MKTKLGKLIFLSVILGIAITACDKDEDKNDIGEKEPLIFESLVAENDTIISGETVKITANAEGKSIIYRWSANTGSILGSGSEITLTTTPCVPEEITVKCTIEDAFEQSETKSVTIVTL